MPPAMIHHEGAKHAVHAWVFSESRDVIEPLSPEARKAAITDAVRQPTRRDIAPGLAEGMPVKTPKPRLALRVGFTGHRPGRLRKAADGLGLGMVAHEDALAEILASVFETIQRDANRAIRELTYERPGKTPQRFYADDVPLIRLVTGLAMGADEIAARVVAHRFRGGPRTVHGLAALAPPVPPEGHQAEWRIEGILPCHPTSFILDAAQDFEIRFPEPAHEALHAYWRETLARPDTLLTLPASWRRSQQARNPPAWLEAERAQLRNAFGDEERRPHVPKPEPEIASGKAEPDFALDYVASAEFLLRQIDILIAVWDGEPSAGPGGAADIVAHAVEAGIPVIYVDADDLETPPRLVRGVKRAIAATGVIGWYPSVLAPDVEAADCRVDALYEAICIAIGPPSKPSSFGHGHGDIRSARDRLTEFLEEDWPEHATPKTYDSVIRLFAGIGTIDWTSFFTGKRKLIASEHWTEDTWTNFILANPDEGLQAVALKRILHRRFVLTDLLAVQFADLYRAAIVKSYFWAALATACALVGFLLAQILEAMHLQDWDLPGKAGLIAIELFILTRIASTIRHGRKQYWHSKFVDYRLLAESLRHLRFLATFGEFAAAGKPNDTGSAWWGWYIRATARELGLPQGRLGPEFQRSLLCGIAKYECE